MKVLALFGSAVDHRAVGAFHEARRRWTRFEYPVLVLLATVGMMMMISANNLIALYMGLELQSLALYVVAAINRDSAKSSEAGLKYFVLGALVVRHAALWLVAGLWLHRLRRRSRKSPPPCSAGLKPRPRLRPGLHHRRPRLQGLRRALPHVDARCL